jgi:hypothetical protein
VRLDRAEPAQDGALVERPRCLVRQVSALGVGAAQAALRVEVVDGGERAVDRRRRCLRDRLQVRAVVADGPVARCGFGERVAVDHRGS